MTLPASPPGYLLLLDTSAAQGPLDGRALAAAGVAGVIAKATDGTGGVDKQWRASTVEIPESGLLLGAYGVLEPGSDVTRQVDLFCAEQEATGHAAELLALDFELAHGLTGLVALDRAVTWCEGVEARLGRRVVVYCGKSFVEQLEKFAGSAGDPVVARLAARSLWCSDYGTGRRAYAPPEDAPRIPRPWTSAAIWQVGPFGAHLPGTSIAVDVNYAAGSIADLCALSDLASQGT